jgi:hypothetical protein
MHAWPHPRRSGHSVQSCRRISRLLSACILTRYHGFNRIDTADFEVSGQQMHLGLDASRQRGTSDQNNGITSANTRYLTKKYGTYIREPQTVTTGHGASRRIA